MLSTESPSWTSTDGALGRVPLFVAHKGESVATEEMLARAAALWNWRPHSPGQAQWMLCEAPVKVAACGRRWGKSESTAIDVALYALEYPGRIQMLIAPTADQTSIIMQEVVDRLRSIEGEEYGIRERRTPYHNLGILPVDPPPGPLRSGRGDSVGGIVKAATICARTASFDGRGIRGRKAHRVIVDEAAFVPDIVMDAVITPLLADYNGSLVLISTPSGRNHFWRAFERGQDPLQPRYASFQFPSSTNPFISAQYLENERLTRPDRVWQIEYLAQFADAEGTVFRNVEACCSGDWEQPQTGHRYAAGLDLARHGDFTVLSVIDRQTRRLVAQDRFNKIAWALQVERIASMVRRYNDASVLVEVNSIGDVVIEQLIAAGLAASAFETTAASKPDLIHRLEIAFETGEIGLPDRGRCPVLVNELLSYAYESSPSGYLRMGAPEGGHDDCVISLALAWREAQSGSGAILAGPDRMTMLGGMEGVQGGTATSRAAKIAAYRPR